MNVFKYTYMRYIGFNLDEEVLEKLKIISFISEKNRSELIKEGLELVILNHADDFDKFNKYVETKTKKK